MAGDTYHLIGPTCFEGAQQMLQPRVKNMKCVQLERHKQCILRRTVHSEVLLPHLSADSCFRRSWFVMLLSEQRASTRWLNQEKTCSCSGAVPASCKPKTYAPRAGAHARLQDLFRQGIPSDYKSQRPAYLPNHNTCEQWNDLVVGACYSSMLLLPRHCCTTCTLCRHVHHCLLVVPRVRAAPASENADAGQLHHSLLRA